MEGKSGTETVAIVRALLSNYMEQRDPPDACWSNSENSGSIVIGVASTLFLVYPIASGIVFLHTTFFAPQVDSGIF